MHKRSLLTAVPLLAALAAGCASGDPPRTTNNDAGSLTEDVGPDTSPDAVDAGEEDSGSDFKPPQFYHSTSGGGLSTSPQYKLQLNFGAPMPRGNASNDEYRLRFGPVSP